MADNITAEELLKEIEKLSLQSDKGFTTKEFQAELRIGEKRARQILKAGVLSGMLTVGTRQVFGDWDGKNRSYTVFIVNEKAKGKTPRRSQ